MDRNGHCTQRASRFCVSRASCGSDRHGPTGLAKTTSAANGTSVDPAEAPTQSPSGVGGVPVRERASASWGSKRLLSVAVALVLVSGCGQVATSITRNVSSEAGNMTSKPSALTVSTTTVGPSITTQPSNETVAVGETATFATGTTPLSYHWSKNGAVIAGATAARYTTPRTTSADNGAHFTVKVSNVAGSVVSKAATLTVTTSIKTVFIILMENHNWSQIKGNASAPYINGTLLAIGAHAEQYYNPPKNHPSLPNYLWLEAGTNFGILNDNDPSINRQSTTSHLVTLLKNANISWKSYDEGISGASCPLTNVNLYIVHHDPFVYFEDVTNDESSTSAYCIEHVRPFTQLAPDLQKDAVADYNFITPNVCDDMHSCSVATGDSWLAKNLPAIMNSSVYQQGGVIFITWDEAASGDGPIGMIVISPFAKVGYENSIHYNHGSTLRTIEEIFHVTPILRDAVNQADLRDLFTTVP